MYVLQFIIHVHITYQSTTYTWSRANVLLDKTNFWFHLIAVWLCCWPFMSTMQGDLTYKLRPQDYLRMDAAFVQKVQVWQLVAIKFGKMNDRYDETERKNSMSAFSLRVIFLTLLVASDNIYNFHACNLYRLSQPTRQRRRRRRKRKRRRKRRKKREKKAGRSKTRKRGKTRRRKRQSSRNGCRDSAMYC